ncbi:hypothetical protein GQ54DRAFT_295548 [Martensiomyces pterosporus]|nr:hypothetical protein GQ54DRAFT_295548 [Martensiomyces pterosporus]
MRGNQSAGIAYHKKPVDQDEQRLLDELRLLSQTGALAQREAVWGMYRRIVEDGAGISAIQPETMICMFEVVSRDDDSTRALARMSEALGHIKSHRPLTEDEIASVRRICSDIEACRGPLSCTPVLIKGKPLAAADACGAARQEVAAPRDPLLWNASAAESATASSHSRAGAFSSGIEALRQALASEPIATDPAAVWHAYRGIVDDESGEQVRLLTKEDMTRLVSYCGTMGAVSGKYCLARIEIDAIANPAVFPSRHAVLISTYAQLGSLENSRRCYQDALRSEYRDSTRIDWSMCVALFRSSRQREGRAIFDKLVEAGTATSQMHSILLTEYTIMHNTRAAFALFDDMRRRGIKPEYRAFCTLATACSLSKDVGGRYKKGSRSSMQLDEIIAGMKSWGYTPDARFFVAVLKGYHRSNQHGMFSGLAARLKAHSLNTDADLDCIMLENAAARKQKEPAATLAKIAIQAPHNMPKVVKALCSAGQSSMVPSIVDLGQYPTNNALANARLELEIYKPETAACPQGLVEYVATDVIQRGFTPSFRLFRDVVTRVWLYGGRDLAIDAYERLSAMGVPTSVGLLSTALRLYINSSTPLKALSVFDELRSRLEAADFGSLCLHARTLDTLMKLLIENRGIEAAQESFDFLLEMPLSRQTLPYGPLIEYYVNHRLAKRSRSIISHVVQYSIPLPARAINVYCRHLAQESTATDFANFLRYLARTNTLDKAADDVFGAFFVVCAAESKAFDFEWAVKALATLRGRGTVWRVVVDLLAEQSTRALTLLVRAALGSKESASKMALELLSSTRLSPWCAVVADSVLLALRDANIAPSRRIYDIAILAITKTWAAHFGPSGQAAKNRVSQSLLAESLERNVYGAMKAGLSPPLVTSTLLILSSSSPTGYIQCLDLLKAMGDVDHDVRFYGAIAKGCSRYGSVAGIDAVMEAMRKRGIAATTKLFTGIMSCYVNIAPPVSSLPEDAEGLEITAQFYTTCLAKVLSLSKELEYQGLPTNQAVYAMLLQACINAKRYDHAENLIDEMLDRGIEHNSATAYLWMRVRIAQSDIRGAMDVFSAIGDGTRCAALAHKSPRFRGLAEVKRGPKHFAAIIHYYASNGKCSDAVALMTAMHRLGMKADAWLYTSVLRQLAEADHREMFVHVMKQMAGAQVAIDGQLMDVIRAYAAQRHEGSSGEQS